MPWTPAQHRLFAAAAHNPVIAMEKGIKPLDAQRMMQEGIKQEVKKKTLVKALKAF